MRGQVADVGKDGEDEVAERATDSDPAFTRVAEE